MIPGAPIAYWINENLLHAFENSPKLNSIAEPRKGMVPLIIRDLFALGLKYVLRNWVLTLKTGKKLFIQKKNGFHIKKEASIDYGSETMNGL